jgi:hypothetical protein
VQGCVVELLGRRHLDQLAEMATVARSWAMNR